MVCDCGGSDGGISRPCCASLGKCMPPRHLGSEAASKCSRESWLALSWTRVRGLPATDRAYQNRCRRQIFAQNETKTFVSAFFLTVTDASKSRSKLYIFASQMGVLSKWKGRTRKRPPSANCATAWNLTILNVRFFFFHCIDGREFGGGVR